MNDQFDAMDIQLGDLRKLVVLRMQQFEELVDALRRCHTTLIVWRYLDGDNQILADTIAQAEKILLKVEVTDVNH
jgi:hypothetical protein